LAKKPDNREKFLYEAHITGDLDHPNIVPIHELGANDDGTLFYAMKLVSGTPWQDVIRERSRKENLEILMKVADAISFAHSRNIIHRDLKPENIMLGKFGEVLVMDWGLAIQLGRKEELTLGGTPAYMAPEMARHQISKIGMQSDIYLLGAILYEIIAGYPPHPGRTVTECVGAAANNQII
ncbi:MAG: serine/threonine protein kinase, partial [Planctomycetaceae bacterium]|nr:serine/threonine protein kinase [Planctomycetaceae bacterium]